MAAIAQPSPMSNALLSMAAPDYQIEQLKAQRAYQLAQALQEQALAPLNGNGGSLSWTQGLAKIAEGLMGGIANRRADKQMLGANQALARGLMGMFGGGVQPGGPASVATPGAAAATPSAPPFTPGQAPAPGQPDPLAPLPDAPPQAASTPPSAAPSAPTGGAPFSLTGDPRRDMMLYMSNPEAYTQQLAAVAGKGATPTDLEIAVSHARQALANGDVATASALLGNVEKQNYIAPISGRPGGVILDPHTNKPIFQTPRIGENQAVTFDQNGHPSSVYNIPGALQSAQEQAAAVASGKGAGGAPYEVVNGFRGNQPVLLPKSTVTGGMGPLGRIYGGHAVPAGPPLGQSEAFGTYGKNSAQQFANTQEIAQTSPQRVQALREMEQLISGPNGLNTGPTIAKMQQLAEEHGLPFGYTSNGFVFNKDAARFIAQNASDLGLNGSDARLGMMANASPNMKMTPQALKVVIPTMIGLEYAKMAKATAATNFAQHNPAGNAQFESAWRQAYDPRMFTAYAQGGPAALAKAPANLRQQWLKDYRTLKGMGVDFTQFAQ